jgi:hypothetical protein
MNDAPAVVSDINEKPSATKSAASVVAKKTVAQKKAANKPLTKKALKKRQPKAESSPKKAPAKKVAAKRQRQPFPYARVLKMWKAGKSSMEIAKAIGRYDSKAADPMHSFRVTLTRFHRGVRIDGKLVKLPHRVSKAALKRATKAGRKAAA